MTADRELIELTLDECLELAGTQRVGRLAVAPDHNAPIVVPVNFVLIGSDIVFRTDPGRKLYELITHLASFQVDGIDEVHQTGWSVLFRGEARIADPEEIDEELHPWVGDRAERVVLTPVSITGRRIRLDQLELDERGYR